MSVASFETKELQEMLNNLQISEDCKIKYSRKDYKHWIKQERGGYDTRQKVLIEESLIMPTIKPSAKKVESGRWYGSYTDRLFDDPKDLDIDHLVPLGEAHRSGACYWNKERKKQYANHLQHKEELIAVSKGANREKGQKDPSKWLPKNQDYVCEYIFDWLIIKTRWGLWIDSEEKESIEKTINAYCKNKIYERGVVGKSENYCDVIDS